MIALLFQPRTSFPRRVRWRPRGSGHSGRRTTVMVLSGRRGPEHVVELLLLLLRLVLLLLVLRLVHRRGRQRHDSATGILWCGRGRGGVGGSSDRRIGHVVVTRAPLLYHDYDGCDYCGRNAPANVCAAKSNAVEKRTKRKKKKKRCPTTRRRAPYYFIFIIFFIILIDNIIISFRCTVRCYHYLPGRMLVVPVFRHGVSSKTAAAAPAAAAATTATTMTTTTVAAMVRGRLFVAHRTARLRIRLLSTPRAAAAAAADAGGARSTRSPPTHTSRPVPSSPGGPLSVALVLPGRPAAHPPVTERRQSFAARSLVRSLARPRRVPRLRSACGERAALLPRHKGFGAAVR